MAVCIEMQISWYFVNFLAAIDKNKDVHLEREVTFLARTQIPFGI